MRNSHAETYYTQVTDCFRWAIKFMLVVVLVPLLLIILRSLLGGHMLALGLGSAAGFAALVLLGGVVLGLLLFFFGWLGRTTIDSAGIKAPRYSGFHDFVPWSEVQSAELGSLSGWPCTLVHRGAGKATVYLMANGRRKKQMIEYVLATAPEGNPLAAFLTRYRA